MSLFFDGDPLPSVVEPEAEARKVPAPPAPPPANNSRNGLCLCCDHPATQPGSGGRQLRRDPVTHQPLRDRQTNEVLYEPAELSGDMRALYPALWCQSCWEAGRWKDGI